MRYQISDDRKRLTLIATADERATLQRDDDLQSDNALLNWLEPLVCNSELYWILPEETGDLTDAPMLGHRDEQGVPLERWAFMDYQVRSVLQDLRDKGEVVFTS